MRRFLLLILLLACSARTALAQTECPAPEVATTPVRLAYVEEGDLWLWQVYPDATQAQPTRLLDTNDISSVDLSDDGERIVFTRQLTPAQPELWVINADGSGERRLIDAAQFGTMHTETPAPDGVGVYHMSWIPGTHTLAFNTGVFYNDGLYINVADDLWTLNVDTGELLNLLPRGAGGEFRYAPDGTQIAIMTPDSLSLINADGSSRRDAVLESFEAIGFGEYYAFPQVLWSSDSRTLWLVVNAAENPYAQHEGAVTVWTVDIQTGATQEPLTVSAFYPSAHLSPDGTLLAYWNTDREGSNTRTLSVVSLASGETLYQNSGALLDFLGWSPDSQHFLYRDGQSQLWLAGFCGEPQSADAQNRDSAVTWIDSGRYFLRLYDGGLYLNTLTGSSTLLSSTLTAFDYVVSAA